MFDTMTASSCLMNAKREKNELFDKSGALLLTTLFLSLFQTAAEQQQLSMHGRLDKLSNLVW